MKKLLMIFAFLIGLMSCGSGDKSSTSTPTEKDRVEVIAFHGKRRCATCMAIEKNTEEMLKAMFAEELKNGTVVYKNIDISTPEGEKLADKYEVTWSSLFVNKWKGGKEIRNNMTEFGFANARNNPETFRQGLADMIRKSLK